ncbi:GNAT family N-acetyltransferase [soil metagenome]
MNADPTCATASSVEGHGAQLAPSPTVRPARTDEHVAVGRITVGAYAADGFLGEDDPYAAQLADVTDRAGQAEVWVAELGGAVVGTVTWCPRGSPYRELAGRDDQAEFRMLAVDPTLRRRGVARSLVDACLARARADGAREVVLNSLPQMFDAHRLYAAYGFIRAPELDRVLHAARDGDGVTLWGFRLPL